MSFLKIFAFILFSILIKPTLVRAACATPTGQAGQTQWISSGSVVMYCDGTHWVDTSNGTGASCAGTVGGTIKYFGGDLQYCNGTNWILMKNTSAGGSGATQSGTFAWDSGSSKMRISNGTNWYTFGPGTPYIQLDVNYDSGGIGFVETDVAAINATVGQIVTVTVTNTGPGAIIVSSASINDVHFTISSSTCSGAVIQPPDACTFNIDLPASGCFSGTLYINGTTKTVPVSFTDGVSC